MIAFAHIPKTAGTTLTAVLRRNLGLRHFDTRGVTGKGLMAAAELRGVQRFYPSLESIAGHGVSPAGDLHGACAEMRYYTFVREPIQRCLSHYQFALACMAKQNAEPDDGAAYFYEWIDNHRNWHARQLVGEESAEKAIELIQKRVSFVGVVDAFDESLVMFREWAALRSFDIRYNSLNVSTRRKTKSPFRFRSQMTDDRKLESAVVEANAEDVMIYRWVVEHCYPEQRRRYGTRLAADVAEFRAANAQHRLRWNDSLTAKAYRNAVFKPLRRFVLPVRAT